MVEIFWFIKQTFRFVITLILCLFNWILDLIFFCREFRMQGNQPFQIEIILVKIHKIWLAIEPIILQNNFYIILFHPSTIFQYLSKIWNQLNHKSWKNGKQFLEKKLFHIYFFRVIMFWFFLPFVFDNYHRKSLLKFIIFHQFETFNFIKL